MTAKQKKAIIIKKFIISLTIATALTVTMLIYGYGNICWIVGLIGIFASIFISKSYLLIKTNATIGIITDLKTKVYTNRVRPSGDKMDSAIIDSNYPAYGQYYEPMILITIKTEKGKIREKAFALNKNTEKLRVGDKIKFTELDDIPQVIEP